MLVSVPDETRDVLDPHVWLETNQFVGYSVPFRKSPLSSWVYFLSVRYSLWDVLSGVIRNPPLER